MSDDSYVVSLYTVRTGDGSFFGGFNVDQGKATFVEDPRAAKKFTNKHDIKLRPDESLVELKVDLAQAKVDVSEPFRPHRRKTTTPSAK